MAVIATSNASALKIKFDCGINEDGDILMRTNTYNYLKADASKEDVMEIANTIVGLQKHDLEAVTKVDNTSLSE